MACEKSIMIYVRSNPKNIFDFLVSQRKILNDFTVFKADYSKLAVYFDGRLSWYSWGEIVRIEIYQKADNVSAVVIHSEPKLFTTLVDWGRNQENVNRIAMFIHSVFPPC